MQVTEGITADQLKSLPEAVRRYLNYSRVIGKSPIKTARVEYAGKFRLGADKPWMTIRAHQTYTIATPGFQWNATFSLWRIPFMTARDMYHDGQAHMFGKLMRLFTVLDVSGEALLQGTMVRYLQEMMWFPTAFLSPYITWQGIDAHCALATFCHNDKSVSAQFYVDDDGRLMNVVAERYAERDGDFHLHTWSTPITDYGEFSGFRIPRRGLAVWQFPDEDFVYIQVDVETVTFTM